MEDSPNFFRKLEDIEVWKRSCRLAVNIYKATASEELKRDFSLKEQIRKSALSISSNVAEGFERDSNIEFKRFLIIAKGSCGELRSQLYILKALQYISSNEIDEFLKEANEISSMLQGLIQHLKSNIKKS